MEVKSKIKRKMVNVSPISEKAKDRFYNEMDNLHGCYVVEEDTENFFLSSINKRYNFCVSKSNDLHWKLIK